MGDANAGTWIRRAAPPARQSARPLVPALTRVLSTGFLPKVLLLVTCHTGQGTGVSPLIRIHPQHLLRPPASKMEAAPRPCDLPASGTYARQLREGKLLVLHWSPLKSLENCFPKENVFGVTIPCVKQELPSKSHLLGAAQERLPDSAQREMLKAHEIQEIAPPQPLCKTHALDSCSPPKHGREKHLRQARSRGTNGENPSAGISSRGPPRGTRSCGASRRGSEGPSQGRAARGAACSAGHAAAHAPASAAGAPRSRGPAAPRGAALRGVAHTHDSGGSRTGSSRSLMLRSRRPAGSGRTRRPRLQRHVLLHAFGTSA